MTNFFLFSLVLPVGVDQNVKNCKCLLQEVFEIYMKQCVPPPTTSVSTTKQAQNYFGCPEIVHTVTVYVIYRCVDSTIDK